MVEGYNKGFRKSNCEALELVLTNGVALTGFCFRRSRLPSFEQEWRDGTQ